MFRTTGWHFLGNHKYYNEGVPWDVREHVSSLHRYTALLELEKPKAIREGYVGILQSMR